MMEEIQAFQDQTILQRQFLKDHKVPCIVVRERPGNYQPGPILVNFSVQKENWRVQFALAVDMSGKLNS